MCDSISLIAKLDEMTDEEYEAGHYPFKDKNETDDSWIEFRVIYPISPLTGAGFKITPVGVNGALYGRIACYQVEVNPPACANGHNRQLVNGVPAATEIGLGLLKYWLAQNGCTRNGIDKIKLQNVCLESVTLTFLFPHDSEKLAREALLEIRLHSEGLLNDNYSASHSGKKVAYSFPFGPPDADLNFTSYVRMREYKLSVYVKSPDVDKAFLLPLPDSFLDSCVAVEALRTLRVEVQVHGKWLKSNSLDRIAQWRENPDAYEKVFNLVRETLRLDEIVQAARGLGGGLRVKRLKKTTVPTLDLGAKDKEYLTWHLKGKNVRDHRDFQAMVLGTKQNSRFSASKCRILEASGIDISIPWEVQHKQLSLSLAELLAYPGEFKPAKSLEAYVFSRASVPPLIEKLETFVNEALTANGHSSNKLGQKKAFGKTKQPDLPVEVPRARHGISVVPLLGNADGI